MAASRIQIPLDMIASRFQLGDRFNSVRATSLATRFSNLRPVTEFFDVKRLSKPQNFGEMQSRVNYNLGHFSSNYAVVFVMLCIYTLLTNWWLLFDIIFVAGGMAVIGKLDGQDLEIGSFRATTSQLYTGLYVVAIPVGLISSPFATIAWLVGASLVVIIGHAPSWGRSSTSGKQRRNVRSGRNRGQDLWGGSKGVVGGSGRVEELDGSASGSGADADFHLQYGSSRAGWGSVEQSGGDRAVALRRRGKYIDGDNEDDEDEDDDDDSASDVSSADNSDDSLSEPGEAELAVLESAMARIRRAQVKKKSQVNLTKAELAALSRHRERERQMQERQLQKNKRRDRVAVPIEHLGPIAHGLAKLPTPVASGDDDSPQRIPGSFYDGYAQGGDYYPPQPQLPSSRARDRGDSPFTYSYVHGQPTARHGSGSAPGDQPAANPFTYMTADSQTTYGAGSASMAPPGSYPRGASAAVPTAARGRRAMHDAETSDYDNGSSASESQVHNTRSRTRQTADGHHTSRRSRVADADSETELPRPSSKRSPDRPTSSKSKKSSGHRSSSATPKHKSSAVASASGTGTTHSASRRRKGK